MKRISVPKLDAILGKELPVLDQGFVRVVDYMGNDDAIVQAARVSYGTGTKKIQEDRALIRYLMRNRHTTPFEMCEIKLHVRTPMDTWRQWVRHRTANINEYSTRYSIALDRTQMTDPEKWRLQASEERQGSAGYLDTTKGESLSRRENELIALSRKIYAERLASGVAREQARKDLTLSTYTEAYWKIDLHNLFHFLSLRMDKHAQEEIRGYATVIGHQIVARWVPLAWEAFLDYELNAVRLSTLETQVLKQLLNGDKSAAEKMAGALGWLEPIQGSGVLKRNRERDEFLRKVREQFGLNIQWSPLS